jgi:hypothetical protein
MLLKLLCRLVPATVPSLLLAAVITAHAQPQTAPTHRPDPLDPKADVPAVRYQSPFAQPARAAHPAPIGWREANDAVARIGGWRAYAREAQHPEPVAAPAPAASAPPKPAGHGGHGGHGHHSGVRQP